MELHLAMVWYLEADAKADPMALCKGLGFGMVVEIKIFQGFQRSGTQRREEKKEEDLRNVCEVARSLELVAVHHETRVKREIEKDECSAGRYVS